MRLACAVVRVLPEDDDLDRAQRGELQRAKRRGRVDNRALRQSTRQKFAQAARRFSRQKR